MLIIEICLAIIALALIGLVVIVLRISSQTQGSIELLQSDVHRLSIEMSNLLNKINVFVSADLRVLAEESSILINNITELSSDLSNKSRSLDFIFRPLGFINSKTHLESSSDENKTETLHHVIKWIVSSASLFKTAKELVKNEK